MYKVYRIINDGIIKDFFGEFDSMIEVWEACKKIEVDIYSYIKIES